MDELIQTGPVLDMIIAKENRSRGYAVQIVFRAVKNGELPVYIRKLKYGSRSINLFDPKKVSEWLNNRRQYKLKSRIG